MLTTRNVFYLRRLVGYAIIDGVEGLEIPHKWKWELKRDSGVRAGWSCLDTHYWCTTPFWDEASTFFFTTYYYYYYLVFNT